MTSRSFRPRAMAFAAALALFVLSAPRTVPAAEQRTVTLDNGVTLLLAPDSLASAVDVGVWWEGGTRLEGDRQSGLTYVLGRLLARTPAAALEARRRLESLGATTATIVQPDFVGLSTTVPPNGLNDALEVEGLRLLNLEFSEADFAAEVAAVRQERARRMANPVGPGLERLYAAAFGSHPYGRPVIGRDADLGTLTHSGASAHARRVMAPGRAVISVVGAFDVASTLEAMRSRFGRIPKAAAAPKPAAARMSTPRSRDVMTGAAVPLVMMGWRGPAGSEPDAAALQVLMESLSAPIEGLHSALGGPKGRVLQLQTSFDRRAQASLLFVIAAVGQVGDTAAVEQDLRQAVERAAKDGLTEAELDRGRRRAEMAEVAATQTVRGRAQAMVSSWFVTGAKGFGERRRLEQLQAVTPQDVRRAASASLNGSRRATVWVLRSGSPSPEGSR